MDAFVAPKAWALCHIQTISGQNFVGACVSSDVIAKHRGHFLQRKPAGFVFYFDSFASSALVDTNAVDGFSRWTPAAVARATKANIPGHNKGGRRGILAPYPEIVKDIISQLGDLRDAGAPLSLTSVRCVIIAIIRERAPEIFERRFKDGSTFQVSDSFCRKFLDKTLAWSMRKGTKAAQKLPADAEDQCETAFLRRAWTIKEHRCNVVLAMRSPPSFGL
ncbi:hypothetical protein B0H10DRAFT_2240540 [Mycena sp. CBHHK59/15]|nr:hypothetical protein B0H10DRAFT_2240540 [Mycena sp. CBHHK59/15]